MADELTSNSATELTSLIASRSVTCVEVVESYLRRIDKINPDLNAILTIAPNVLDQARARDLELAGGHDVGPLHGLPITIKDSIDTAGIRTTYGSRLFTGHVPAVDATVVARLKAAGVIILGKTNVPEMAIPYETDNPVWGRTNNPHDVSRTAGGSSGGEAASIAAKISPAGVGSDLSGSLRVPAHFCGIAALKPTTGVIPMTGHLPRANGTLSMGACIGPMARCVEDLALLFSVMVDESEEAFKRSRDSTQRCAAWYTDPATPVSQDVFDVVAKALEILKQAGFTIREENPPGFAEGPRLWIELFARAAREQIREIYRGREHEAGPLVSPLLESKGENSIHEKIETAEAVAKAVVEREHWREELLRWMKTTPLVIAPVSATPAFEHGATRVQVNGDSISVFRSCGYSHSANVFGLPAATVRVGRSSEGLPIGVQVIGRAYHENEVMSVAAIIERAAGF